MTLPASNIRSPQPAKLPTGVNNFAKLIQGGYTFIDKSLLIDQLLRVGSEVTLINRPRRFGKTLNLSMLQHFFAAEVNGQPTQGLFEGLAVAKEPAAMAYQGHYPVIFITLKNIKGKSFEKCQEDLRALIADLYEQYPQLLNSPHVSASRRKRIQALLDQEASFSDMDKSLKLLSELLYKHHGQKVVILIDEYDTPINVAYSEGFYPELIDFMRAFLGAALKDNPYLSKAVVTGILQVSKENIFSGLNNSDVYTVLQERYSACFGFTEAEVAGLLHATGLATKHPKLESEIKRWYNGYRFGQETIYNPWSIINCLNRNGALEPHWANTGEDAVLKKLMAQADAGFKSGLERLLQHDTVQEPIDQRLVFGDLDGNSTALWSLLLFSGYLTALGRTEGSPARYELTIPNHEVRQFFEETIRKWFTERVKSTWYESFLESLAGGDAEGFESLLREYLLHSASFFDAQGRNPENFYHGLVLGMIVGLRETHDVYSNRESGYGRYDVAIFPKAGSRYEVGVLLEFKQTRNATGLERAAEGALAQIDARRYKTDLRGRVVKKVLGVGMAFAGKEMGLAYRVDAV